ncbi:MAG TPA: chromate transporter [Clostridiaceae bacterium]|nr:chromate transporter [Clostridiaceae bacterium]
MIILSVYYAIHDTRAEGANSVVKINYKIVLLQIACFILPILVLLIPNIILKDGSINYTLQGIISTVTSFGGGEAYLTVADGLFVSSNIVSPEEFYSYIVPVANALPGPILVKILSGIGYFIGSNEGGLLAGYLLSALGFVIGVGATCIVFVIVHMVYKAFSEIEVFVTLKKWILPAICGLLISTILSMFHEMFKITAEKGISGFISAIIAAMVIIGAEQLHKRLHIHDVILIILSGAVSLFMLNVI